MGSVQPSLREHEYDPGWGVCNVAMTRQEPPVDYSEGRFDVLKRLAFARLARGCVLRTGHRHHDLIGYVANLFAGETAPRLARLKKG